MTNTSAVYRWVVCFRNDSLKHVQAAKVRREQPLSHPAPASDVFFFIDDMREACFIALAEEVRWIERAEKVTGDNRE